MTRLTQKAIPTLCLIVFLASASPSQALMLTNNYLFNLDDSTLSIGPTTDSTNGNNWGENDTFISADGFNSGLGTLTSTKITFISVWQLLGVYTVTDPDAPCSFLLTSLICEDNVAGGVYFNNSVALSVRTDASSAFPLNRESDGAQVTMDCFALDGTCTIFNDLIAEAFSGTLFETSDSAELSGFIDNQIELEVRNDIAAYTTCEDDEDLCTFSAISTFGGVLSVEYTYDAPVITPDPILPPDPVPVPAPASIVLFGLGLAGLRMASRRKVV